MEHQLRMLRIGLWSIVLLTLAACTQHPGTSQASVSSSTNQGGINLPFSISAIPNLGDLKATLDCPDGSHVIMKIDTSKNTASGSCSGLSPGTNEAFTIHFTYGSANIELARAAKTMDVIAGSNLTITFLYTDYDESFDDDSDGYTNLYEVTHGTDPTKPENTLGGTVSVASDTLVLNNGDSNIKATLDCPNGNSIAMAIDNSNHTASSGCSSLTPGNGQLFTIYISFGSVNIELANATKTVDVVAGTNPALTFTNADFDTSLDSDGDGFTNLYEVAHSMDPTKSNYSLGGNVSGLKGTLVLDNGGDQVTVNSDGTFTFAVAPANGAAYQVSVLNQPSGQSCTVNFGKGSISGAAVANIYVGCAKNGLIYLAANDGATGVEPYISDGTALGTVLLKNINTNTSSNPSSLTVVNGVTFFVANDGVHGIELWKSDNTGTSMVKDIRVGISGSSPYGLTAVGTGTSALLYFSANDGVHGQELWQSDGTDAGTHIVMDINPTGTGNSNAAGSFPDSLTTIGSTVFFSANDGVNGIELWKSYFDTTNNTNITSMVKDIYLGGMGQPSNFCVVGSTLYFSANDGINGNELWQSDGSTANTTMVADIYTGNNNSGYANSSYPAHLTAVGNTLYFSANDGSTGVELWKFDGSTASRVADIYSGTDSSNIPYNSYPTSLTAISNTLYFAANDGTHGTELWKSDSTGTTIVKDINPNSGSSYPTHLTAVGGTLYFSANNGSKGVELWKSDGSDAGTIQVSDINPDTGSSYPAFLNEINGVLYFAADDGNSGQELWKNYFDSISNTDVTTRVMDIDSGIDSSNPSGLVNNAGVLYFSAFDGSHGLELWRSDSTNTTSNGTTMVADISLVEGGSNPSHFITVNGIHYFKADDGTGMGEELWRTDGTQAGTYSVKRINPHGESFVYELTAVGNTLYFSADNGINGWELWKTDGTEAGTVLVRDIFPGAYSSYPYGITFYGNDMLFIADNGSNGAELWKSDGTFAGTVLVKDVLPGAAGGGPVYLTPVGNTVFFTAYDGLHGSELWKSNGTNIGTTRVSDINPGTNTSFPVYLTAVGNSLYFSADDGTNGRELWKSDGINTTIVADINSTTSSMPSNLIAAGNTLYFTADDGTHGVELWKNIVNSATDTTALAADINPTGSSSPYNLTVVGSNLYFVADNGIDGDELWKTDSTTGVTSMVADINTIANSIGTDSSKPENLTAVSSTLYFMANDGTRGYELWKSDSSGTSIVTDLNPGGDGLISVLGH